MSFDSLVAQAGIPEAKGREVIEELGRILGRVSLTKAREIARDLGISEVAWNAAVSEDAPHATAVVVAPRSVLARLRTVLTAGFGFAAGACGGWLNGTFNGDLDVAYGALLVAGGVVLWSQARQEYRRKPSR